jgi:hypothetical protein
MIEQWVLDKLHPLRAEPLIILRDPQRMIRRGDRAVDGWAEEAGFSVLWVSGNLGLRELYEQIRDDPLVTKVLLVDRSRDHTKLSLFYPDLESRCTSRAKLTVTLREFLVENTGDHLWPATANDRNLSRLILAHLPQALDAYSHMRAVRAHGFPDSDLFKIVLGAALRINPFRKLKPADIRRLCIESHDRLGEIRTLFASNVARDDSSASTDVLSTLEEQIKKADKPWCWMLDHDPEEVVRAFTLAALLHQHGIEYQVLLGNFDPALVRFQDIPQKSIEQTLKEMLQADPDRIAADVSSVELFLKDDVGNRLAFFLSNRCQVELPERAKAALLAEMLSPLVRGMSLVSLLADLFHGKNVAFHTEVLNALDGEGETGPEKLPLAARRPTEQWTSLVATYRRAIQFFKIAKLLREWAHKLKVAKTDQLQFEWFDSIWNDDQIDRLDYYASELQRLFRVGNLVPIPTSQLWPALAERWQLARQALGEAVAKVEDDLNLVNGKFQDLYHAHYARWIGRDDSPVIFTHQFVPRFLKPHWDAESGRKAVLLIFDGLRLDAWEELVRPVLEERFDVLDRRPCSAILPTETQLSRKAISAGCLPTAFLSTSENVLLEVALKTHLGLNVKFRVEKQDDDVSMGISARYVSDLIDVVIFNFTDKNLHHTDQDLAFLYNTTVRAILQQDVRSVLREIPEDAVVFITSDHGFCEVPKATYTVPHTAVTDAKDVKYRVGRLKQPLEGPDAKQGVSFKVEDLGIPDKINAPNGAKWSFNHVVFPRPGLTLKRHHGQHDPDRYTHGGLSMAECLVPMIVMGPKGVARPPFELVKLDIEGNAVEGENLEVVLVVTARASASMEGEVLFQLAADIDDLPARKEVFSGGDQSYRIRWVPKVDQATSDEQKQGKLVRMVTVVASYHWQVRTVRSSVSGVVEVKLDSSRVRRRLDSRLDSIMGLVPKGLR